MLRSAVPPPALYSDVSCCACPRRGLGQSLGPVAPPGDGRDSPDSAAPAGGAATTQEFLTDTWNFWGDKVPARWRVCAMPHLAGPVPPSWHLLDKLSERYVPKRCPSAGDRNVRVGSAAQLTRNATRTALRRRVCAVGRGCGVPRALDNWTAGSRRRFGSRLGVRQRAAYCRWACKAANPATRDCLAPAVWRRQRTGRQTRRRAAGGAGCCAASGPGQLQGVVARCGCQRASASLRPSAPSASACAVSPAAAAAAAAAQGAGGSSCQGQGGAGAGEERRGRSAKEG